MDLASPDPGFDNGAPPDHGFDNEDLPDHGFDNEGLPDPLCYAYLGCNFHKDGSLSLLSVQWENHIAVE